jgi:hypothetical protein
MVGWLLSVQQFLSLRPSDVPRISLVVPLGRLADFDQSTREEDGAAATGLPSTDTPSTWSAPAARLKEALRLSRLAMFLG